MNFEPKSYKLKESSSITIRVAGLDDAQNLLDLKREYIENTTTIPLELDEYPDDLQNEIDIISDYIKNPNSILLVAEFKGELIGNIDLTGGRTSAMAHTGMIGMGIKEKWRNIGLGKCLMGTVIEWAKESSWIEIIWLDVYASNQLGYNLYRNTGFKESGRINDFFKDEDGYKDKIQMYQRIREKTNKIKI